VRCGSPDRSSTTVCGWRDGGGTRLPEPGSASLPAHLPVRRSRTDERVIVGPYAR
jgi:hypothetical protein